MLHCVHQGGANRAAAAQVFMENYGKSEPLKKPTQIGNTERDWDTVVQQKLQSCWIISVAVSYLYCLHCLWEEC